MNALTTLTRRRWTLIESPVGPFYLCEDGDGSLSAGWADFDDHPLDAGQRDDSVQPRLIEALMRYFQGDMAVDFSFIPSPNASAFFRRCWDACRAIPPGQVISYGELARRAGGTPAAARAAGQSMRRNPLPVVVPCHRVVGADRSLHGYSGSTDQRGLTVSRKRALLQLEGALP